MEWKRSLRAQGICEISYILSTTDGAVVQNAVQANETLSSIFQSITPLSQLIVGDKLWQRAQVNHKSYIVFAAILISSCSEAYNLMN
jgi:hypothetical protein